MQQQMQQKQPVPQYLLHQRTHLVMGLFFPAIPLQLGKNLWVHHLNYWVVIFRLSLLHLLSMKKQKNVLYQYLAAIYQPHFRHCQERRKQMSGLLFL